LEDISVVFVKIEVPLRQIGGLEKWFHSFLTSILDTDERLTSCLGHLTPRKETWNPLNRKVGGPQSWSGCFGRRKKSVDLIGFQNQDHLACSAVAVLTATVGCGMREMKIQQGHRKEGRKEGIDENMKEVLIKLYKTSLDTTLLIIYNQ